MKPPEILLTFATRQDWRAWLELHHATDREAWLVHHKKNATRQSLTYDDAVEEALCFGWIDGLLKGVDGESYALRYSPRRPKSVWSESNKRRVERLIEQGLMTAAGLARIADARQNGHWDAATASEDLATLPEDLAKSLDAVDARASFDRWLQSRRKQYLYWLQSAKRAETREKRIEAIVDLARAGG